MIEFATAADVSTLLTRVLTRIDQYSEIVLCSPFISDQVLSNLREVARPSSAGRCDVEIITTPQAFNHILVCTEGWQRTKVVGCSHLHAKFYLAVARKEQLTEAIITSANLTVAGLTSNIELGVRVTPATPHGRTLLRQIVRFARRLTTYRSVQWKRH
jgi:hypothetical protein